MITISMDNTENCMRNTKYPPSDSQRNITKKSSFEDFPYPDFNASHNRMRLYIYCYFLTWIKYPDVQTGTGFTDRRRKKYDNVMLRR